MKLSLIIPAYDEEKRILKTLMEYNNFLKKIFKNNFEIIIIPNNCKDNTLEVVKNFAKKNKQIKFFNFPNYCGKGNAVMKGFEIANGDYIGFVDADNSTNPENFYKLYDHIVKDNLDGAIASRRTNGFVTKRNSFKRLSSNLFNLFVNFLFNLNYKDTQCGAKLFTKKTTGYFINNYMEGGWGFDVDLLYLAKRNKFKIKEIPIKWEDSEESKLTLLDSINCIYKLIKLRYNRYKKEHK